MEQNDNVAPARATSRAEQDVTVCDRRKSGLAQVAVFRPNAGLNRRRGCLFSVKCCAL